MSKKFVDWKSGIFKLDQNTLGKFGELIVEDSLRKRGFKVRPFHEPLYRKEGCGKTQAVVEICREDCKIGTMSCLTRIKNLGGGGEAGNTFRVRQEPKGVCGTP